jgi:DNA polymerase III, alpha subunit
MNYIYQNYHRHSMYTNPRISDSTARNVDYAKKAVEYGHGIISTMEHGWQGRYIEGYELAEEYGLKFVFGVEAYWVKDRHEQDRTNAHICLIAKTEKGRQEINDILAEANITGFYHQPRIDIELILSLNPDDVIVTTACVAYWKYEDIDDITERFHTHFGENFYLEVQYHNTEKQKEINRHILTFSEEHKIQLIMGCDSHYIDHKEAQNRSDYLVAKNILYPEETGWYLDYTSGEEAYRRFAEQCILSHKQIVEAMENTNVFLSVEKYENPVFTQDIKMPTLHPGKTQDEKDEIYENLVWEKWHEYKKSVPESEWENYEREIKYEVDIVKTTKHADYFLTDHEIVKMGKSLGGVITSSGRGSAVSFFTNMLLGFTDVDRIAAKVKMYPERFMSPTRILETKSLADLDMNLGDIKPFAEAQKLVLGNGHSEPMIAYGTMQKSAAWKMYARSQNVEFSVANEISEQIRKYETALKRVSEDDKDSVNIMDYIDEKYETVYLKSTEYLGTISDWKIAPCSYLLYQGDIRKEVGLVRAKDNLCCLMDGMWAEKYKFLKNDLLKVSVVDLIDRVYKRIGISKHSVRELLNICTPDNPAWSVYGKKCTLGINQVEQTGTSSRVAIYAPKNISELCAFIAAIRPGFKSMYKTFESRDPFSYGISAFDELIQTPEMPNTFVLYQEMAMATLNYAGIPMSECYEVIKNIAKKRVEKVLKYKESFIAGFSKTIIDMEQKEVEEADKIAHMIWQILEDSSAYCFNASHSYCVAVDSLYGAYLKSHYPLEFYETFLKLLEENGEKDRMSAVKKEAENYFKIKFPSFKFGQDNREITANTETREITNSLKSIKGFGETVAAKMYELQEFPPLTFTELLYQMTEEKIQKDIIDILIKIGYFSPEYGNITELTKIRDAFDFLNKGNVKSLKIEKLKNYSDSILADCIKNHTSDKTAKGNPSASYLFSENSSITVLIEYEKTIKEKSLPDEMLYKQIENQIELLGYADISTNKPEDRRKLLITEIYPMRKDDKTWGYSIQTRSIGTGKTANLTVYEKIFKKQPLYKGDILYASDLYKNKKGYWHLNKYEKI